MQLGSVIWCLWLSVHVRDSCSLYMYSYMLAGQPVLSLCPVVEQSCCQQTLLIATVRKGDQETTEKKSRCCSAIVGGTPKAKP